MTQQSFFTSSSVMGGHPDKLCDRISDALVDAYLTADPESRVRAEAAAAGQVIFLVTDVAAKGDIDTTGVVRRTISETCYFPRDFSAERCAILTQAGVLASHQSAAHPKAPSGTLGQGSSEQTTVFGYACSDTPERMPLPIHLAHRLTSALGSASVRQSVPGLGPDGEVQVTVEYADRKPVRIHTVVVQLQYLGPPDKLARQLRELVLDPLLRDSPAAPDAMTRVMINPAGPFETAGPARDAGHTGRKNADDTYGGAARHGGHAMSGKDPSRLDRSASYAARYIASNVAAAGLAAECEVMLSYAIGEVEPISIAARCFGTGVMPDERLSRLIEREFDLRPAAIEAKLSLRTLPQERGGHFYAHLAAGGHFGRPELDLPWERPDAVKALQDAANG